ncbi:hypothetical protein RZS08_32585, partial [Arthrospira platensis SPKY1]|nr:hypothetical protein [Arthrospira platensis SPKY1]
MGVAQPSIEGNGGHRQRDRQPVSEPTTGCRGNCKVFLRQCILGSPGFEFEFAGEILGFLDMAAGILGR